MLWMRSSTVHEKKNTAIFTGHTGIQFGYNCFRYLPSCPHLHWADIHNWKARHQFVANTSGSQTSKIILVFSVLPDADTKKAMVRYCFSSLLHNFSLSGQIQAQVRHARTSLSHPYSRFSVSFKDL